MPDEPQPHSNRRQFIVRGVGGAALVGVGAAAGVFGGRLFDDSPDRGDGVRPSAQLPEPQPIDPKLMTHHRVATFGSGVAGATAILLDDAGRICVAGGDRLAVIDGDGTPVDSIDAGEPITAICRTPEGELLAACRASVRSLSPVGGRSARAASWGLPMTGGLITAIAAEGDDVFLADARHRLVFHCDRTGRVMNSLGAKGDSAGPGTGAGAPSTDGFVVPSPYFDLAIGSDGLLWVVNPGRHRFEAYTFDGDLEATWGMRSDDVKGFCGCCNPTSFAETRDGRFVTAEKGIRRVKVYSHRGELLGVVASPAAFPTAKSGGPIVRTATLDVAVGPDGRIHVLETATGDVHVYESRAEATA